ncbi:MAG: hypothetical protein A2Z40_03840 [Deltaproteobacteria bacterium RBG_19FT_COMBO_60_16]|nr:MAG: hypothetical protein A2Z40_03840 [Deltaproteobacteria bacterium RBG_19FT_COMBO_60_16]
MPALSLSPGRFHGNVPWWLYDIDNSQLITTSTIPDEIKDSKSIVIAETVIPGRNFAPARQSSNGNRKISFALRILRRNATIGNIHILKQFDLLRNQAVGLAAIFPKQFSPNPKVLYSWGTGSVPLVYLVSKCDYDHHGPQVNEFGNPQFTDIEMELILDETDPLYKAEELFRKVSALVGSLANAYEVAAGTITGGKAV